MIARLLFLVAAQQFMEILKKNSLEDTTIQPMNPYGYTKLTIEKILKDIFISSNKEWKIANLRYFNQYVLMNLAYRRKPLNIPNNLFPYLRVAYKNYKELKYLGAIGILMMELD